MSISLLTAADARKQFDIFCNQFPGKLIPKNTEGEPIIRIEEWTPYKGFKTWMIMVHFVVRVNDLNARNPDRRGTTIKYLLVGDTALVLWTDDRKTLIENNQWKA